MNGDKRMKGFDQPKRHESVAIRSASVIDDPDFMHVRQPLPAGCFRFDDGTTQNWTINQLYGWSRNPSTNQLTRVKLTTSQYTPTSGFQLGNSQNRALSACVTPPFLVTDQSIERISLYLESPDLSAYPLWQSAKGYRLDLHRLFHYVTAPGNVPGKTNFSAQLQMRVRKIDTATGQPKIDPTTGKPYFLYGQYDPQTGKFIDTPVNYNLSYPFEFKPSILTTPNPGEDVKLLQLRVRCTAWGNLGQQGGETDGRGCWLIGNVCPLP